MKRLDSSFILVFLKKSCWINSQRMVRKTIEMGSAKINHLAKEISGAWGKVMLKILAKDRFGGVPTRVAMPPMEALYARARNRPTENCLTWSLPRSFSRRMMIARAMGSIIIVVAVLLIHMDKNAVAAMKCRGLGGRVSVPSFNESLRFMSKDKRQGGKA